MSKSHHLTRQQRRALRRNKAAQAARERKVARPWERALTRVRDLVVAGHLPAGCQRVVEAMARCHHEHGAGVADRELLIGYGDRGDPRRIKARAASREQPPVHIGIAEEAGLSRRWAIACVAMVVQLDIVRRWYGGPKSDYRQNVRPQVCTKTRAQLERVQGVGGAGWANGYTVDGIPDPQADPDPSPSPTTQPTGELPNLTGWRRVREEQEALEQRRLRRRAEELTSGP